MRGYHWPSQQRYRGIRAFDHYHCRLQLVSVINRWNDSAAAVALSYGSIGLFSLTGGLICTASPAQPVIQSAFVCAIFLLPLLFGGGETMVWLL
jgi:hypothetical protein